jgi:hypothetical protein
MIRVRVDASTHALAQRGCEAGSNDVDQQGGGRPPERHPPSVTAHATTDDSMPWLSFDAALIRGLTIISIS